MMSLMRYRRIVGARLMSTFRSHFPASTANPQTNSSSASSKSHLSQITSADNGIFGFPWLRVPEDLMHTAKLATTKCQSILSQILASPPAEKSLELWDQISSIIMEVVSVSQAITLAHHTDSRFKQVAHKVLSHMQNVITQFSLNPQLAALFKRMNSNEALKSSMTSSQLQLLALIIESQPQLTDASNKTSDKIIKLRAEISQMESTFLNNISHHQSNSTFKVDVLLFERSIPAGIRNLILKHISALSSSSSYSSSSPSTSTMSLSKSQIDQDGMITIPIPFAQAIITHSSSRRLRSLAWTAKHVCAANIELLDSLIAKRHELARLTGHASAAHAKLASSANTLRSPEEVFAFLDAEHHRLSDQVRKDLEELETIMKENRVSMDVSSASYSSTTSSLPSKDTTQSISNLSLCDLDWLHQVIIPSKNGNAASLQQALYPYFTFSNCIKGFQLLCHRLFDCSLQQIHDSSSLLTFELRRLSDDVILGELMMDVASNSNSATNSSGLISTIPLSLGHLHASINASHSPSTEQHVFNAECDDSRYQRPRILLVGEFGPWQTIQSPDGTKSQDLFLNHSQLTMLFHEFGHCLHFMLSRSPYHQLCPIFAGKDFVELPSVLMEKWSIDYEFMSQFALHFKTNQPIPKEFFDSLNQQRMCMKSIESQQTVFKSMFDLLLHCESTDRNRLLANVDKSINSNSTTADFFKHMSSKYLPIQLPSDASFSTFAHLIVYGSMYYSYSWCHHLSSRIWQKYFQNQSMKCSAIESAEGRKLIRRIYSQNFPDEDYLKNV